MAGSPRKIANRRGEKEEKEGKERISPAGALAHKPCCHTMTGRHRVGLKDKEEKKR